MSLLILHLCSNFRMGKQGSRSVSDPLLSHIKIVRVNLNTDGIPAPFGGGYGCRTGSHERIEHSIAYKGEHPDQSLSKFFRVWRGVIAGRGASDARPYRLEPLFVILIRYDGQYSGDVTTR